jgi:uncharacterized membrane protein HdeD (DUF308 family)
MEMIRKTKKAYTATAIVMIALGAMLLLFPTISALTVCYIVGGMITLFGIVKLIGYFSKDLFGLAFQFDLALGIFSIVAGILIILHPTNIVNSVPVIIGVFVLMDGAFKMQTAIDAKKFGMERWWGIGLLAVVTCIAGLFLIINPFEGAKAIMMLLGATLIVDGVQNLCVVLYTVKSSPKKGEVIDVEYEEVR